MTDTIRIATAADAPALYALLQQAYAPLAQHNVHFTITRAPVSQVEQAVASQTSFVLERPGGDDRPVLAATVTVRFPWMDSDRQRTPYPFLHWFAVAPAFKRQGLGSILLAHVEERFLAAQVKAPATYLATAIEHPWLPRYYQQRGYVPFDRSVNALGTSLVWLRKVLIPELYEAPARADAEPAGIASIN
ncbi:GNAT family N-acetyltransferase [Burkholderia sp. Ac-20379]|uniref:GNAT family N-acetyltransferase n=1 Tax=Burkholderia sp. Ac-20379 TaxID=2703900 RepID=UPI00197F7869|nr:GNAT family N-acetyltransferase [Burkholderia sp. Ac-20379]MBN3725590.1 GNAT family N-acetyltransferase [Burkholderia sp. Ac-20379]